jgi:hypothetical protein
VAQRKRGGPITHRSEDRNLALINQRQELPVIELLKNVKDPHGPEAQRDSLFRLCFCLLVVGTSLNIIFSVTNSNCLAQY